MKLIDILVEELPKRGGWPDGANYCHSMYENIYFSVNKPEPAPNGRLNSKDGDLEVNQPLLCKVFASGAGVEEVTREQYEAALAAKNDGWIEWGGGKCPVEKGTLIDVKWRDGKIDTEIPAKIRCPSRDRQAIIWHHAGHELDIIAYRLHKPQEEVQAEADDEADLNECIGQDAAPVWNGEGLPPVGCGCEYSLNGGKTWWKCKIDYIVGTQGVVMLCDTFEGVQYVQFSSYGNALKFRPIRSEAERKRDAAKNAIAELCRSSASNGHSADLIYDAIAAGEIPGVKLED